jgi:hypothetical protein
MLCETYQTGGIRGGGFSAKSKNDRLFVFACHPEALQPPRSTSQSKNSRQEKVSCGVEARRGSGGSRVITKPRYVTLSQSTTRYSLLYPNQQKQRPYIILTCVLLPPIQSSRKALFNTPE